jgi:hypothetical protein
MERYGPRSISIREGSTLFWALGCATQAYQARLFVRLVGTTALTADGTIVAQ